MNPIYEEVRNNSLTLNICERNIESIFWHGLFVKSSCSHDLSVDIQSMFLYRAMTLNFFLQVSEEIRISIPKRHRKINIRGMIVSQLTKINISIHAVGIVLRHWVQSWLWEAKWVSFLYYYEKSTIGTLEINMSMY